ncbi:hypothetical protein [Mycolicibacterium poriferae]|jgi:hypothetical protein|uniref:hypothetical protein n=1 Tax=Mycolicibacterium poriferae TaxID=39694 RepID=UPI0024BB090B|nr:hypothetical protein [Mycolicibacterium poriferae]
MTTLAERLAPHLAGLVHPGDADHEPFPLILPIFGTMGLPESMAAEDAEAMGLPTPNIGRHFIEALQHLLLTTEGIDLDDPDITQERLADLRAAAGANEVKRNAIKVFCCETCEAPLFRVMVKGFDTDRPTVPAATKQHECKRR